MGVFCKRTVVVLMMIGVVLMGSDLPSVSPGSMEAVLAQEEQAGIRIYRENVESVVAIAKKQRDRLEWQDHESIGSGFIWDAIGHVVTNHHVIMNAGALQVVMEDGRTYDAELLGSSPRHDLAVLRVSTQTQMCFCPVKPGDSSQVVPGQKVFAIGSPLGHDTTLTTGVVSALNRTLQGYGVDLFYAMIQTDAALNPGNSGGPLLNIRGEVIGINTEGRLLTRNGIPQFAEGMGFAVPINTANWVVENIIQNDGEFLPTTLGIRVNRERNSYILRQMGLSRGVVIDSVTAGSGAQAAGLRGTDLYRQGRIAKGGDVITHIDGYAVTKADDLATIVNTHFNPGDEVRVWFYRLNNGQWEHLELRVKLRASY